LKLEGKSREYTRTNRNRNEFLNRAQVTQQLREWIDKWDYIKLKIFCTRKEVVTRLKRQPTEWEKIFDSYTSDKGLITRIYRELKKLNSQKNQ
jgi:recombinational DNA repair ATPase RecF